MKVSKAALFAALMAGGSTLAAAPSLAQTAPASQQQQAQPASPQHPAPRRFALSRPEQAALNPLIQASAAATTASQQGQTPDWAAVRALIPAAQAAAQSNDARYLLARVQLEIAVGTNDVNAQEQALTTLLSSSVTAPTEAAAFRQIQASIVNKRAEQAFAANDFATAERLFAQLLAASPNDQRIVNNLAIVRQRMGNSAGAIEGILQQISTAEAAGQRAPQDLYRRAVSLAYTARDSARALDLATRWVTAYPTAENWRDTVRLYRQLANPDGPLTLDALRLARATNGLEGQDDYLPYASTVDQAGLPGETKAVIDEGITRGALRSGDASVSRLLASANRGISEDRGGLSAQITQARASSSAQLPWAVGDALYGYGRYAEAAELYRLAATKSGANANRLNLRLGSALAMAGRRAEAETALRAAGGDAAPLAKLWLAWLASRPA